MKGVSSKFHTGAGKMLLKVAYLCTGLALLHGVGTPLQLCNLRICTESVYGVYCPVAVVLARCVCV